jgi:hypothetical protein
MLKVDVKEFQAACYAKIGILVGGSNFISPDDEDEVDPFDDDDEQNSYSVKRK